MIHLLPWFMGRRSSLENLIWLLRATSDERRPTAAFRSERQAAWIRQSGCSDLERGLSVDNGFCTDESADRDGRSADRDESKRRSNPWLELRGQLARPSEFG